MSGAVRVSVSRFEGDSDLGQQVAETLAACVDAGEAVTETDVGNVSQRHRLPAAFAAARGLGLLPRLRVRASRRHPWQIQALRDLAPNQQAIRHRDGVFAAGIRHRACNLPGAEGAPVGEQLRPVHRTAGRGDTQGRYSHCRARLLSHDHNPARKSPPPYNPRNLQIHPASGIQRLLLVRDRHAGNAVQPHLHRRLRRSLLELLLHQNPV